MFSLAFHFLTFLLLISLFLFICQTTGRTFASLGNSDFGMTKKLPFYFWSVTSLCMAEMNSSQSGTFINSCMYRVSVLAYTLYAINGSSWPMGSSFGNISLRQNILPSTSWLVSALIFVVISSMSHSAVWRAQFDLLLVLLAFWVATISSSGGDFGTEFGRKYSPGSVGG